LNSRSALLLAVLDPGAQTVGGPRNSAFEGLPKGTINITFDGINAQDNVLKSSDGFFAINDPRIDDIEEFGITTTGNDPSKNGQGAVQMSYVSKRGGNAFHGGVWEYNRNTDFNSNYYFSNATGVPRQGVQLNDFGYKIGGPVFKDKLFFFTDFDFFQFPQSLTRSRTIYNAAAASALGNFTYVPCVVSGSNCVPTLPAAGLTGPGSTAPWVSCNTSTSSPVCVATLFGSNGLAANGPVPSLPTAIQSGPIANANTALQTLLTTPGVTISPTPPSSFQTGINYNAHTMQTRRYPDVRFDYNLTKHHTLEFDYHYAHYFAGPDVLNGEDATFPVAPFNTSAGSQISNRNLFVVAERWTIGSNMSNEIRVGVQSAPVNFGLGLNNGLFAPFSTNLSGGPLQTTFQFAGVSSMFLGLGGTQGRNGALGELHETFGWTHGAHQFTFGADATQFHYNDFFKQNPSLGLGVSAFDPAIADFTNTGAGPTLPNISSADLGNIEGLYGSLVGRVTSYSGTVNLNQKTRQFDPTADQLDRLGQLELGFYGGDSWRVRPNLTVNYGLRWEFDGPPYDKNNMFYMLANPNQIWGISGVGNLFSPGSTAGIQTPQFVNDRGKTWYHNYYKAFAPTVGIAYQPNWDNSWARHLFGAAGKTVLRGGFAIAYDREGLNAFFGVAQDNPGYFGNQTAAAAGGNTGNGNFTAGSVTLGGAGTSGALSQVVQTPSAFVPTFAANGAVGQQEFTADPHLKPPMVESWNAGIQRELSSSMVLEIRYQANHGVGLTGLFNINEVNVFENNFLPEFAKAQSNETICQANATACKAAQATAEAGVGVTAGNIKTSSNSFADWGLAGQVPVTVETAAFGNTATFGSGPTAQVITFGPVITPGQLATASAAGSAYQANPLFFTGTLTQALGNQGAGSFANFLATNSAGFGFANNMQTAGFPFNYFIVNPAASNGSFALANAYQSTFNALIVDLRHRPSHGLQFDVNYTFSKSLTNYNANSSIVNSSFTTLRDINHTKGPAPFQAAHAIKGQLVYQLPFGAGHRFSSSHGFVNRIISGWEVDDVTRFQTGQPVLVTSGLANGATFNQNDAGINLVGLTRQQIQSMLTTNKTALVGAVTYVPTSLLVGKNANTAIFQPCNVPGTLCGRPFFTGPSFFRTDLSVVKTTKITERVNFEMRAELLNAFNDADFYWGCGVSTSPCSISTQSTRFGQMGSNSTNGAYSDINTTQDPGGRVIQLVGRINF
jgi:hypothetical protein